VRVGVQYLEAWLRGSGCVPLYNLMEDAATAEISRTQVWQWIRHGARLDDRRTVTEELFGRVLAEELATIQRDVGEEAFKGGRFAEAAALFEELSTAATLADFLTLPAYELLEDS
jgi:malate synthase